ncbi:MAG: AMIN domain-containing protein, partial [Candidatus Omnitrophica bacterium]|nr:AMIN domain-containing protein [Candidatus Omnitrophota bacterium]
MSKNVIERKGNMYCRNIGLKFLAFFVVFNFFLGLSFSQSLEVKIRTSKHQNKERIVLDLGKKVEYKVSTFENPKRIVVDIMEDLNVNLPKSVEGSVEKYTGGTRLIFEKNFKEIKTFSLQNPFRIVIDVYNVTGKNVVKKKEVETEEKILKDNVENLGYKYSINNINGIVCPSDAKNIQAVFSTEKNLTAKIVDNNVFLKFTDKVKNGEIVDLYVKCDDE